MSKILIIDDDLFFLDVTQDLLELHEFQVIAAKNGRLGLQLAETQRPDLIICDIQMPELDGYEVLNKLQSNSVTQNIPVIFITGEATESVCRRVMELGGYDCLIKPCRLQDLIQAIKAQLNG